MDICMEFPRIPEEIDAIIRLRITPICVLFLILGNHSMSAETELPVLAEGVEVTNAQINAALERAGDNRDEIKAALASTPERQLRAVRFLIAYMPERDLRELTAEYITQNVALAFRARESTAWGKRIPEAIFFNDVLPYASVNERRDAWRADFFQRFMPLVAECESATEAAQILNRDMFGILEVKYHARKRPKPDQSPLESIQAKYASCTGLSILLIDACRAVGVPARFAGTPRWAKKRGNHSWVEIWDGKWHFTGACEYNAQGLNKTWFSRDASHAIKDDPRRAIYASSWKPTGTAFPLIWNRDVDYVAAVNITDRYAGDQSDHEIPTGRILLGVELRQLSGERIGGDIVIRQEGKMIKKARTTGPNDDANHRLEVMLDPLTFYVIEYSVGQSQPVEHAFQTSAEPRQRLTLTIATATKEPDAESSRAIEELTKYFALARDTRPTLSEQAFSHAALSRDEAKQVATMLWEDHASAVRQARAEEMATRALKLGDKTLKFDYTVHGEKPSDGRSLFISLHGGGGTRARVNDRQWENQKQLYQPDEGVYVAPRAPTNTWDLWHQPHIDPMFDRLIENLVVFEDVDPNRVYVMGYSAGGDGVYQLAPRMADRWAAAAMMAGHPNDASPLGLRNIGFALHMGANDSAYNRNEVAQQWKQRLSELQQETPDGYRHQAIIHEGKGHWMDRQDAVAVPWMSKIVRDPVPPSIVWKQDDVTHARFYWLAVGAEDRRPGTVIRADRKGQTIDIQSTDVERVTVLVNDDMLDLDKPVTVNLNGVARFKGQLKRSAANLETSLSERADPAAIYSTRVTVSTEGVASNVRPSDGA